MKLRIFPRLLAFILLPSILCMLAMTLLSQRQASNALNAQIEEKLAHVATLQTAELTIYFDMLWGVGKEFATKPVLLQLLSARPDSPGYEAIVREAMENFKSLGDTFGFGSGALIDLNGTAVSHSHESSIGSHLGDREYFKEALRTGKQSYQVVLSRTIGALVLIMATPVLEP